jgi:hypothetical protein
LTSGQRALTTDAVFVELANFFARSPMRMLAISSIRRFVTLLGLGFLDTTMGVEVGLQNVEVGLQNAVVCLRKAALCS